MSQALVKLTINNAIQGPHLMSLAGWADLFTKTNFALVSYEKFQPSFRDEKRPRSWDEFWLKIQETKHTRRNTKILTFATLATLKAVLLQFIE